jgi:hypothetical protein
MTDGRRLLLETLAGHFSLLKAANPKKANSVTAKRAQRYVSKTLRECSGSRKRAA